MALKPRTPVSSGEEVAPLRPRFPSGSPAFACCRAPSPGRPCCPGPLRRRPCLGPLAPEAAAGEGPRHPWLPALPTPQVPARQPGPGRCLRPSPRRAPGRTHHFWAGSGSPSRPPRTWWRARSRSPPCPRPVPAPPAASCSATGPRPAGRVQLSLPRRGACSRLHGRGAETG